MNEHAFMCVIVLSVVGVGFISLIDVVAEEFNIAGLLDRNRRRAAIDPQQWLPQIAPIELPEWMTADTVELFLNEFGQPSLQVRLEAARARSAKRKLATPEPDTHTKIVYLKRAA